LYVFYILKKPKSTQKRHKNIFLTSTNLIFKEQRTSYANSLSSTIIILDFVNALSKMIFWL